MATKNISWRTSKTPAGLFAYRVIEIVPRTVPNDQGHYADIVTLKTGTRATRAQAKGRALQWVLFFKRGGVIEVKEEPHGKS